MEIGHAWPVGIPQRARPAPLFRRFPHRCPRPAPPALHTLAVAHPDLQLHIHEQEPEQSLPLLTRSVIDVTIVQDWGSRPLPIPADIHTQSLLQDTADLALPAHYPLAHRSSLDITEVADKPWIACTSGTLCHDWLLDTLRTHHHQPCIVHAAVEYPTQLALVQAGLGIALTPRLGRDPIPRYSHTGLPTNSAGRSRSRLSPPVISNCPAVSMPTPGRATRLGAARVTSAVTA